MGIRGRGAGTTNFTSPDHGKLACPVTWIGFVSCNLQSPLEVEGSVRGILAKRFWSSLELQKRCAGKTASLRIVIGSNFCKRVWEKSDSTKSEQNTEPCSFQLADFKNENKGLSREVEKVVVRPFPLYFFNSFLALLKTGNYTYVILWCFVTHCSILGCGCLWTGCRTEIMLLFKFFVLLIKDLLNNLAVKTCQLIFWDNDLILRENISSRNEFVRSFLDVGQIVILYNFSKSLVIFS